MPVHNRTISFKDETFYFASLDGEDWLEINQPLTDERTDDFRQLLEGDGNFMPLTFTRRFIDYLERNPAVTRTTGLRKSK